MAGSRTAHLPAGVVGVVLKAGEWAVGGAPGGILEGGHGGVHSVDQAVDCLVIGLYGGQVELIALAPGLIWHQRQQQERKHGHHCL